MSKPFSTLSRAYQKDIDEACKHLPDIGITNMMMTLIFNDDIPFVMSNDCDMIQSSNEEGFFREEGGKVKGVNEPFHQDYYLCHQPQESTPETGKNNQGLYPVYNIIRQHYECTFVIAAINDSPISSPQAFYEKTVHKFEEFCIGFLDDLMGLIIDSKPAWRFSFVLNNKPLRDAVIRQGYETDVNLTFREQECLWYAGHGKSTKEIARLLHLSPYTVEQYLKRIRELFSGGSIPEIMLECIHRGIIGKVSHFNKKEIAVSRRKQQVALNGSYVV